MLNPKELMLGNWVYESERSQFPMQVVNIDKDMVYLDFDGNEGDVFDGRMEDICPIPLTGHFLVKNGFVRRNLGGYDNHFVYGYFTKNEVIEIRALYDCEFSVLTFDRARIIKYVHQLQNILTIAGIEIEFKI